MSEGGEVAQEILQYFDVGRLITSEPAPLAFLNGVWRVETDRGRWMVKEHPPGTDPGRLEWSASFLQRMRVTGTPVDWYIHARDGRPYAVREDRLYTVAPCLPGVTYRGGVGALSKSQVASAVDSLALFHRNARLESLGRVVPGAGQTCLTSAPPGPGDEAARLEFGVRMLEVVESSPLLEMYPDTRASVESAVGLTRGFLFSDDYEQLPRFVIHGDYRHKNLLFLGDRVTGIVDWDLLQVGSRLTDLCGRIAQHFAYLGSTAASVQCADSALASVLRHYARRAQAHGTPLTSREAEAVYPFMIAGAIHTGLLVAHFISDAPLMSGERIQEREEETERRWRRASSVLDWLNRQSEERVRAIVAEF